MSAWPDDPVGAALRARIEALVGAARPVSDDDFDALAVALCAWQRGRSGVVARVAETFLAGREPRCADEVPAVPTDVFKVARVACFDPALRTRAFETSGTTRDARGRHEFADTSLYARACVDDAARRMLVAPRYRCVMLAQPEAQAILKTLGKHKSSKACVYINKLADVDMKALEKLIKAGVANMKKQAKEKGWPLAGS